MTKTKKELIAIDPHCSVCRSKLLRARRGRAGVAVDGLLYCHACRPHEPTKAPPRIDIMSDPTFVIQSCDELSMLEWHRAYRRLVGFSKCIITKRVGAALAETLSAPMARKLIEDLLAGPSEWSPVNHPNVLAWLVETIRHETYQLPQWKRPQRPRNSQVDLEAVRTLFPEPRQESRFAGVA